MFNFIKYIAQKISRYLCKTDSTKENYDYYEYAIIGLISSFIYCVIGIILSLIFGYFPYIWVIIPCLLNLRSQSGGSHAKTSFWCFITTTLVYFIIGMSTYLYQYFLILFLLSFIGFSGIKNVPRYTKVAVQHSEEKQKFFRISYLIRLNIVFLLNLLSIILHLIQYEIIVFGFCINFAKLSCVFSSCVLINRFSLSKLSFMILDKTGKDTE